MKKDDVIFAKAICWICVGGFSVGWLWFAWEMHQILTAGTAFFCGNSVTEPLSALLNTGTPVGMAGVFGLACLAYQRFASRWSVLSSALLVIAGTAGLLVFGFRFFRDGLPGLRFSQCVWWLKPLGV